MEGNLLFVGGDLSGIQKFIYNITSKRAMVSLKGRSYYLKDFTEKVCNEILAIPEIKDSKFSQDEMKIYCSGGKFYLQVPDTQSIRNTIADIRNKTEETLWKVHQGQLSINIDYVPFVYDGDQVKVDGETGNIGLLWTKITEKFNALKNQKFKSLLLDQYQDFFEPQKVGGKVEVCQVTGIEGAEKYELPFKDENGDKESLYVHDSVKEQIEQGLELRDKQHFKMLEEYAEGTYLGVLRMDVDGLGARFIKGFESMKKYKDFSGKLDKFFDADKGNLHTIQEQYKEHLNIVYAGGDDIFVVGRWDKVIEFADDVRTQFAAYRKDVLNDTTLTISGGIAIVNAKYPISKAAELAGEAEDAAKKYNNGKKNAFNMFGESVSWKDEFDKVKEWKKDMVECCSEPTRMPRSILHKLMQFNDMRKRGEISYIWNTAYFLKRFSTDKKNDEIRAFCDRVQKALFDTSQGNNNYRLLALAARWAELELREIKDNTNDKNE